MPDGQPTYSRFVRLRDVNPAGFGVVPAFVLWDPDTLRFVAVPIAVQAPANVAGTTAIDWDAGLDVRVTLSAGANTLTISNSTIGRALRITLLQPAGMTPATVTWWAGIRWAGGVAPVLSTNADVEDLVIVERRPDRAGDPDYRGTLVSLDY